MDPLFEVLLDLGGTAPRARAHTLHRQLEAAIRDGRLVPGSRLPATRGAQALFGVARNTILEVYERLREQGLVVARQGSGTFVADWRAPPQRKAQPISSHTADSRLNPLWLRDDMRQAMGFWQDGQADTGEPGIDFRPALVDASLFPHAVFRRVSARQLRGLERKPAVLKSAQGNQGNYRLRQAIVQHIGVTRGVVSAPDSVLVTSGAQQAFDLLARTLVIPGQTVVAIEDPGYPPMRAAFAAAGARLAPVPVDQEGLVVDAIPHEASIICVTPSHQFPLGVSMSMARRAALLALARGRGAVIVEDDYDGEFRYAGSPMAALRTAEAADTVCYVGTFSKSMLPALRLGFIVAPDWALPTLTAAKNCLDWHCATPVQLAVAGFIAEGHLTRHVRTMRDVYKQRRALLLDLLASELSEWLTPLPSFYGMHVAAYARGQLDLEAVTYTLLQHNIKLHTLARYHAGLAARPGLVISYGTADLPAIRRGMLLLRQALLALTG